MQISELDSYMDLENQWPYFSAIHSLLMISGSMRLKRWKYDGRLPF
jgi:hypothetical protein